MDITVVIPLLNEEHSIEPLAQELVIVLGTAGQEFEVLFVDDGSSDNSFAVLERQHAEDRRLKVLRFRRNFGKSAALAAGFAAAQGEIVFTMDGDLQDDPLEIPRFLAKLEEGYDLVSGWKYPRHDPLSKTLPSRVFNWTVGHATGVHLHDLNCGFKAYRRAVIDEIDLYGELHRYTPVLAHQLGYRVTEIKVKHRPRRFGRSKFGVRRFARGFFDLLTVLFLGQYSWRPLHLFGWVGLGSAGLGVLIGLYLTVLWFQGEGPIGNRPLLTLGVLLIIVGIQFFSIGLLAEMLTRAQPRDTLLYSIREQLE